MFKFKTTSLFALVLFFSVALAGQDYMHKGWIDFNKNGKKDLYEDPKKDIDSRLEDLWSRMTFEEKIVQIRSQRIPAQYNPQQNEASMFTVVLKNNPLDVNLNEVRDAQDLQIRETRLGIPLLMVDEALHGLRTEHATSFPQSVALGATWNTELMSQVAGVIAQEAHARGLRQVLSPVVDLARDPRWGRAEECYSEDPFLTSEMAVAFCYEFESRGVMTTPKHFVANSGYGGRDSWPQFIDERYLNEVYFKPYKACIQRAGSRSIMPSYGSLGGLPTVANPWLLQEKARNEWGFKGYFGSDFGAVRGVADRHFLTQDKAEVAALCINAGMDVEWPWAMHYGDPLDEAIERGLVEKSTIEEMAKRILRLKFEVGLFDNPFPDDQLAEEITESDQHKAVALEAARQSIVLLKNDGDLLPFDQSNIKTLAVIGHNAKEQKLGGYSGIPNSTISMLEGLELEMPGTKLVFHNGIQSSLTGLYQVSVGELNGGKDFHVSYFANTDFKGEPAYEESIGSYRKIWRQMDIKGIDLEDMSARVTGSFTAGETFTARLIAESTGTYRLFINGEEILNNMDTRGSRDRYYSREMEDVSGAADMGATRFYTDYTFQEGIEYTMTMEWQNTDPQPFSILEWDYNPGYSEDVKEIIAMVDQADAVILVPGGIVEGEFRDRPNIDLPDAEEQLIRAVAGTGKPMAVVLVNGGAIAMGDWEKYAPAIVETWFSGQMGGKAIAEVLSGKTNPGGKLPVTFPKYGYQCPVYYDYFPIGRVRGFQDPLKGRPMFPFGHGLSYTTFKYGELDLGTGILEGVKPLMISCDVTNTGPVAGDEVIQVYFWDEAASVVRPVKELKAFKRIHLEAGETKHVSFTLTPDMFSFWNREMEYGTEPGWHSIYIGSSSEDIRLRGRIEVR